MKLPSSSSFALNVEVEDFCLTLLYVGGVLIVGLVGTSSLKLRGIIYILLQYSVGCWKLDYLALDFLDAKHVTVQYRILMAYDIQKASKIFERKKSNLYYKNKLYAVIKFCFANNSFLVYLCFSN